jgi:hypothetical protein
MGVQQKEGSAIAPYEYNQPRCFWTMLLGAGPRSRVKRFGLRTRFTRWAPSVVL